MKSVSAAQAVVLVVAAALAVALPHHGVQACMTSSVEIGASSCLSACGATPGSYGNIKRIRCGFGTLKNSGQKYLPQWFIDHHAELTAVVEIDFSMNDIPTSQLPAEDVFSGFPKLVKLFLQGNKFSSFPSPAYKFNLPVLETLSLYDNVLTALPPTSNMPLLQVLKVLNNRLAMLSAVPLGTPNLRELHAQDNTLMTHIGPADIFKGSGGFLHLLKLSNCALESLPFGVFAPLTIVDTIYLEKNNLRSLPEDLFSTNTNLRQIMLHDNNLRDLPFRMFGSSTVFSLLTQLNLNNNPIERIPHDFLVDVKGQVARVRNVNIYMFTGNAQWKDINSVSIPIIKKENNLGATLHPPVQCCTLLPWFYEPTQVIGIASLPASTAESDAFLLNQNTTLTAADTVLAEAQSITLQCIYKYTQWNPQTYNAKLGKPNEFTTKQLMNWWGSSDKDACGLAQTPVTGAYAVLDPNKDLSPGARVSFTLAIAVDANVVRNPPANLEIRFQHTFLKLDQAELGSASTVASPADATLNHTAAHDHLYVRAPDALDITVHPATSETWVKFEDLPGSYGAKKKAVFVFENVYLLRVGAPDLNRIPIHFLMYDAGNRLAYSGGAQMEVSQVACKPQVSVACNPLNNDDCLQTPCIPEPGYFLDTTSGLIKPCPAGTHRAGGDAVTSCTPCNAGQRSEKEVASTKCLSCARPGEYAPEKSTICSICTSGSMPNTLRSGCTPCPTGEQSVDGTQCRPCDAGSYLDAGTKTCTLCAPGTFTNAQAQPTCSPCSAGQHQPNQGATSCLPCSAGEYSARGAKRCLLCPAGSQSSSDKTTCFPGVGQYADATTGKIVPCPRGTAKPVPRTGNCTPCPPGEYAPALGMGSCAKCPAGTYADQPGHITCKPCPEGTYNPEQGARACTVCGTGNYTMDVTTGATQCSRCFDAAVLRRFAPLEQMASCIRCPPNTSPSLDGSTCIANKGYFLIHGRSLQDTNSTANSSNSSSSNELFLALLQQDGSNVGMIHTSPSGSFNLSLLEAAACPAGTYMDAIGARGPEECKPCPAGFQCPDPGWTDPWASPCVAGTFSFVGWSQCMQCPTRSTSANGFTSCTCTSSQEETSYLKGCQGTHGGSPHASSNGDANNQTVDTNSNSNSNGVSLRLRIRSTVADNNNAGGNASRVVADECIPECAKCPDNAFCSAGATIADIEPLAGFFRLNSTSTEFVRCKIAEACPASLSVARTPAQPECMLGYEGFLCGSCSMGYSRLLDQCSKCPDNAAGSVFTMIGFIILFGFFLLVLVALQLRSTVEKLTEQRKHPRVLPIGYGMRTILNYFQMLGLIGSMRVDWDSLLQLLFNSSRNVSDVGNVLVGLECLSGPIGAGTALTVKLIAPVVVAVFVLLPLMVAVAYVRHRRKYKEDGKEDDKKEGDDAEDKAAAETSTAAAAARTKSERKWNTVIEMDTIQRATAEEQRAELIESIKHHVIVGGVVLFFIMHPFLVQGSLATILCEEYPAPFGQRLVEFPEVECFQGAHWPMVIAATVVGIVFYGVLMPCMVFFYLSRLGQSVRLGNEQTIQRFGALYQDYDARSWWWEGTVIIRKVVIAAILVVPWDDEVLPSYVAGIFLLTVAVSHVLARPNQGVAFYMELASILVVDLTLFVIVLYRVRKADPAISVAMFILNFLVFLGLVACVIHRVVNIAREILARRRKEQRSKRARRVSTILQGDVIEMGMITGLRHEEISADQWLALLAEKNNMIEGLKEAVERQEKLIAALGGDVETNENQSHSQPGPVEETDHDPPPDEVVDAGKPVDTRDQRDPQITPPSSPPPPNTEAATAEKTKNSGAEMDDIEVEVEL